MTERVDVMSDEVVPTEATDPMVAPPAPVIPDRADAPVSEVTERFLRAVVADVPLGLIEELHLFSPLRQGTVETGIAVLAARWPTPEPVVPELPAELAPELALVGAVAVDDGAEVEAEAEAEAEAAVTDDEPPAAGAPAEPPTAVARHTVYTARYRYVIKGPERGKWEASVKAEADAPLVTVETVVRGVQRRAGEESEIVRFTPAQIAKALRVPLS